MINGKKILAVIPARGGSKGLPGKNIRPLVGKPLISWSIEQGLSSKYIDKVVVSTDSPGIAEIARKAGAHVPFLRPERLATDNAASIDVILHAIDQLSDAGEMFDIVVMLEPTSPLRESADLDNAIKLLIETPDAESIVGICRVESAHPQFLVKLEERYLRPYINKDYRVLRRQEIDDLYFFEGSLYISHIDKLRTRKNFYHDKCIGYVVPKWKSFEVDDMIDFFITEALLSARLNGQIAD